MTTPPPSKRATTTASPGRRATPPPSRTQPIHTGRDFYVPTFRLNPPHRRLPRDVLHDVTSVSYRDGVDRIDSFELTVNNWDTEQRTFKYSNGPTFLPGKELELWLGYFGPDPLERVMTGEITALRPTFPASGPPVLAVSALDVLHRFRTAQHTEVYTGVTDSQVAQKIGGRLKIPVATAPLNEKPYPYLLQDNEYDIVFLLNRARQIGYKLWVEESDTKQPTLHFKPTEQRAPVTYRLAWGESLIDFQPELTTARQVKEVIVRAWDRKKKSPITGKATRAALGLRHDDEVEQAFNQRMDITSAVVADQKEADRMAMGHLLDIAHEMVTATGSTIGVPDLQAGRIVQIDGLGKRFDGRYFLTATTHTLNDAGYITSFECRRED